MGMGHPPILRLGATRLRTGVAARLFGLEFPECSSNTREGSRTV